MGQYIQHINKNIIEWAILRSGSSLQDFYVQNVDVEAWVEGQKLPTVKQLEKFTKKVHVPFGYMFLPEPPQEKVPLPFFRTGETEIAEGVSLNVFHTIQLIQERQNWLTEYLSDLDFPDLNFVGKYDVNADYREVSNDIRKVLGLKNDWAEEYRTWEDALDGLTQAIEEVGVIVTFNGVVGNNTHRPIEVSECRGFVLVNKKVPFLFINSRDAKAAQMFTLIHELAHIWLGVSAGFDNAKMIPANDPTEVLCDQIAAEFLVPEQKLIEEIKDVDNIDFRELSRVFKVSQIVIRRRLLDLKIIEREEFFSFYNEYIQLSNTRKLKNSPGGNFYAVARKRISTRFAGLVNNAVKTDKLLYREAFKLTNLKGKTYDVFMNEYL